MYFGYPTFTDYYRANSTFGYPFHKKTEAQAYADFLKSVETVTRGKTSTQKSVIAFLRMERIKKPTIKFRKKDWYFVVPEAREKLSTEDLNFIDDPTLWSKE